MAKRDGRDRRGGGRDGGRGGGRGAAKGGGGPLIEKLWPTHLLRHRLPGFEAANAALAEVILAQEAGQAGFTTAYLDQNFMQLDHPAAQWLSQCANKAVADYVAATDIDYDVEWSLQGWANINRLGDYHNLHNHPHSWLSGTYYVSVPDEDRVPPGRTDRNPGAISFFDPRGQANMNAIKGDPQVDPEFRVTPQPGEIMIWPAFLHHFVHQNLSDRPRISVSFNVVLKWKDAYIP